LGWRTYQPGGAEGGAVARDHCVFAPDSTGVPGPAFASPALAEVLLCTVLRPRG
jgi:hypothetical protein